MENFVLGPIQEMWLQSLEQHPERQCGGKLGIGSPENYKACCLGEGLLCLHRYNNQSLDSLFDKNNIIDKSPYDSGTAIASLFHSYGKLGLYTGSGRIMGKITFDGHKTLTLANDNGKTWPEIAAFIRANPTAVFKESK